MHGVGLLCRHSQRSHDLSDEDIRPALTLRHQKIAQFSERYGVNREWLLAGTGRIFKTDPIAINPNITRSEFASAVGTLPAAERRPAGHPFYCGQSLEQ